MKVREKTFDDVVAGKPESDLPILFEGSIEQCLEFARNQPGFVEKPQRRSPTGCYFYKTPEKCLIFTA